MQNHTLRDGVSIPPIGLGTYPFTDVEAEVAVAEAIARGYRLIDTAVNYGNEVGVGRGVRGSGIDRSDVFVQSKLPGRAHSFDAALRSAEESLEKLGLDYLDSYLIHWPNPSQGLYVEAWQALIRLQEEGTVKSIGVSNFLPEHINTLIEQTGVVPATNQIELHPYSQKTDWTAYNTEHAIMTQCWSPLGKKTALLQDTTITQIAERTGRTPAQVILRWEVQNQWLPIPKSGSTDRMEENLDVFTWELSDADMAIITALECGVGRGFDPNTHEEM